MRKDSWACARCHILSKRYTQATTAIAGGQTAAEGWRYGSRQTCVPQVQPAQARQGRDARWYAALKPLIVGNP